MRGRFIQEIYYGQVPARQSNRLNRSSSIKSKDKVLQKANEYKKNRKDPAEVILRRRASGRREESSTDD